MTGFRKMRRFKQQLDSEECLEILKRAQTAVLGVIGDEDWPYTVPINFVFSDGKIYFHGANTGHKIDSIRKNKKVTLCIVDKDKVISEKLATDYRSVIVFGRARILDTDEEIFHAAEIFGLKYNSDKELVDREIKREWNGLCCVEISIEHMTGKQARAGISQDE